MKILLLNRQESLWPGGDMVHLRALQGALQQRGHQVDYSYYADEYPGDYDVVHLFHVNFPWCKPMAMQARRYNKPLVVTPIFYADLKLASVAEMRMVTDYAKAICPMSYDEGVELQDMLGLGVRDKVWTIPAGIPHRWTEPTDAFVPWREPYVLSVGRAEALKGHHYVVRACAELGIPCVVIGEGTKEDVFKSQDDYLQYRQCFEHIPHLPHEELRRWYQGAKVFALATISDRMSLVMLEAMSQGCNIAMSMFNRGNGWFPNLEVFNPFDHQDVVGAIDKAWTAPRGYQDLARMIPERFTWDKIAQQYEQVYAHVLS